jgi:flagellin
MQIQVEVSSLVDELDRVASQGQFNKMNMLTGAFADPRGGGTPTMSMWFHIGPNAYQYERVFVGTMTAKGLGVMNADDTFISLSTPELANAAIAKIDDALMKINKQRADLGAYHVRLEFTTKGLMNGYENTQASESRIRDVDMAEEMVDYVKNVILSRSSVAMLAQANLKSQHVLQLLGG